ncbi:hypothetical protein L9F63_002251, partial [Diploptera punctata]
RMSQRQNRARHEGGECIPSKVALALPDTPSNSVVPEFPNVSCVKLLHLSVKKVLYNENYLSTSRDVTGACIPLLSRCRELDTTVKIRDASLRASTSKEQPMFIFD